ncbi:unnamed protein product [Lactuca saligna]|uniref:Glabrous enhancer-binding protein-like DBD domain-containing protein n=1 Tax=Lactuca saligna TaxID=75948 RepID=A0AA35Y1N8_LACSI|nr:unnamed protein product [Lactuca saligna]
MAEANPKRLANDGGDPPKKKNTTSAGGSKQVKIEDTSNSKSNKGDVEEVNIYNLDLLNEILEYKNWKGTTPCDNPDDLREFCTPYIRLDIGNARGWIRKMRELKTKFNDDSDPTNDVEKEEFEVWKKIWGGEPKGDDHDPGVGSSK